MSLPPGIAFFDMDLTLVGANTGRLWVRDAWRRGELGRLTMARLMVAAVRYRLGLMDPRALMADAAETLRGTTEDELRAKGRSFFEREVRRLLLPRAVDRMREHQDEGCRAVLLTASLPYVAHHVAAHVGADDVLCTELEVADGRFTGRYVEPICYGDGKRTMALDFAARHGVDPADCWFYTDSYGDLPALLAVGHPVVVHPDPRLEREARRRSWPRLDFRGERSEWGLVVPHA